MCTSVESLAERGAHRIHQTLGNTWRWRLLHHATDGQAVFAYYNHDRKLIGKFCTDTGGSHSFRALKALEGQTRSSLRVPAPILFDSDLNFLVTGQAVGASCMDMPILSMSDRLQRIGRALKELHLCEADFGSCKSMSDHLSELIRPQPEILAQSLPQYSRIIYESLNRISSLAGELHKNRKAPLHRDFHLRQLFDNGRNITVVDWDLSAQGDPAFDVAYFLTYIRTHYSTRESDAGINDFLEGYDPDKGIVESLRVYELFNYLRRACRRFRLRDENWQPVLESMLLILEDRLRTV